MENFGRRKATNRGIGAPAGGQARTLLGGDGPRRTGGRRSGSWRSSAELVSKEVKPSHACSSRISPHRENPPQLLRTLSAFLGSEARRISTPFFASGPVAE